MTKISVLLFERYNCNACVASSLTLTTFLDNVSGRYSSSTTFHLFQILCFPENSRITNCNLPIYHRDYFVVQPKAVVGKGRTNGRDYIFLWDLTTWNRQCIPFKPHLCIHNDAVLAVVVLCEKTQIFVNECKYLVI